MKYREGNLLERWGGGSKRINTALELSKYTTRLNHLWKSPVQVNKYNFFFARDFLVNDLTEYSNYYPAIELLPQIRNLQKRHFFQKPYSINL